MGQVEGCPEIHRVKLSKMKSYSSEGKIKHTNKMKNSERYSSPTGKDFEITVKHKPARSQQHEAVVNKTNSAWTSSVRDRRRLLSSRSALVKPQLGDSAHFWALHLNKGVSKLQVKVTCRIRGLENMTYKRRAIEKELFGLKCED